MVKTQKYQSATVLSIPEKGNPNRGQAHKGIRPISGHGEHHLTADFQHAKDESDSILGF